jgi:hypothetical protein
VGEAVAGVVVGVVGAWAGRRVERGMPRQRSGATGAVAGGAASQAPVPW